MRLPIAAPSESVALNLLLVGPLELRLVSHTCVAPKTRCLVSHHVLGVHIYGQGRKGLDLRLSALGYTNPTSSIGVVEIPPQWRTGRHPSLKKDSSISSASSGGSDPPQSTWCGPVWEDWLVRAGGGKGKRRGVAGSGTEEGG